MLVSKRFYKKCMKTIYNLHTKLSSYRWMWKLNRKPSSFVSSSAQASKSRWNGRRRRLQPLTSWRPFYAVSQSISSWMGHDLSVRCAPVAFSLSRAIASDLGTRRADWDSKSWRVRFRRARRRSQNQDDAHKMPIRCRFMFGGVLKHARVFRPIATSCDDARDLVPTFSDILWS